MKKNNKFKSIFKSAIAIVISVFIISEMILSSFSYALESSETEENIQVVESNVMEQIVSDECGENCSHVYRDLDDNLQPICKKGVDIINDKKNNVKRAANASGSFAGQGIYLVKLDDIAKNLGNIGLGINKIDYVDAHFLLEGDKENEQSRKTFRMYKMGGTQEPTYSTVVPNDENGVRYNRVYFTIHFKDNTINPSNTLITNFTAEDSKGKIDEIKERKEYQDPNDFKERYEGNILLTPKSRNCLYIGIDIYKTHWSGNPSAEGASLRNQILYVDNRSGENDQSSFWPTAQGEKDKNILYINYRVKDGVDTNGNDKYKIVTEEINQYTDNNYVRYYKFPSDTKATERSVIIVSNNPPSKVDNSFPSGTKTYMFLYNISDLDNCLVTRYLEGKEGLKRNFVKYSPTGDRKILFRDKMNECSNIKYRIYKEDSKWGDWIPMNRITDKDTLWTTPVAYSNEYTKIQFKAMQKEVIGTTLFTTDELEINKSFSEPVFFVDVFQNPNRFSGFFRTNSLRGCWVRKIENNNHGDIVKNSIPNGNNREKVNQQYMAKATFYDYYSDIELKGLNIKSESKYIESKQAGTFNYAVEEYYRQKKKNQDSPDDLKNENIIYEATGLDENIGNTYEGYSVNYLNKDKKPKLFGQEGKGYSDNQAINVYNSGLYYSAGIVDDTLNSNDEMTQNGTDYIPQFNEGFLRGNNALDTNLGAVYPNVDFGFTLNSEGYWEFDSLKSNNDASSRLKYDKEKGYYIEKSGKPIKYKGENSFLPFDSPEENNNNKKNHLFGMNMSIPFRSTKTGTIKTNKGNTSSETKEQDVIFKFTGDDDLWLFIDDKLALDLGGIHDAITGEINFNSGDVTTYIEGKSLKIAQKNIYTDVLKEKIIAKYGEAAKNKLNEYGKKYLAESEHKLNIFYMERGLEKSNLRMRFNFPTKNMLSVSNDIDVSAANKFFEKALDTLGGINYFIKNQVTVGEPLDVEKSAGFIGAGRNEVFDSVNSNSNILTPTDGSVKAEIVNSGPLGERKNVLKYSPSSNMPDWADKNTMKKYLVSIAKSGGSTIDISDYAYLKFDIYNAHETSATGTELYVQVTDLKGNSFGDWASNLTYKSYSNTLPQGTWASERISIKDLMTKAGSNVDFKNIKSIEIGYNRNETPQNPIPIYIDDIKLYEEMVVNEEIGFSIQDRDISDYKSLENLNPIDYSRAKMSFVDKAWYMLRTKYNGSTNYNDGVPFSVENGMFGLANGQKAEFINKFRLGTYIQLEQEDLNNKIFDTTWTLKEENKEIDTNSLVPNKSLETVINDSNVEGFNNRVGYNISDGRTVLKDGVAIKANKDSSGNKKGTFIFRRFDNPDDKGKEGVNLNVEYKNTLKVGGIYLVKNLENPADFDQRFRFHIHYRNIAGRHLEENIDKNSSDSKTDLVQNVEVIVPKTKTSSYILIKGIPAGTSYTIHEINNTPTKIKVEDKCYKYEFDDKGNLTNTEETDENKKHQNVYNAEEEYTSKNEETGDVESVKYNVIKGKAFNSVQAITFTNNGYRAPNGGIRITKNLSGTTYTEDKDFLFHVHYEQEKENSEGIKVTENVKKEVLVTVPAGKIMGTTAIQNIPINKKYWVHEVDESNLSDIKQGNTYKIGTLGDQINNPDNILQDKNNPDNITEDNRKLLHKETKVYYNDSNSPINHCGKKGISNYATGIANTSQKEYIFTNSGPVSIAIRKRNQYDKPLIGAGFSVYKKETDKETFIKEVRTSYYEKKVVPKEVPEGEYYDENTNRYNDGTGLYIVYGENENLYYYKPLTQNEIADYEEDEILGQKDHNRVVETLAIFSNLRHGTYRVDETTIPPGYRKVDTEDIEEIKLPKTSQDGTIPKNVNDAIFSVVNYDRYVLPKTGKGRILKWIVLGMLLVAISAGFIILRNKKEEGDN